MKKLKKSVKAIIISSVAILCVVAIVLGYVFGLKKPTDDPNFPSSPYGYTSAQAKLAEEINKNALKDKTTYQIFDNSILTNFKSSISSSNIVEFKSNYFVYADENQNQHLVLYRKGNSGAYEYKEIEQTKQADGTAVETFVKTNASNYALVTRLESQDLYSFAVVYFGNFNEVVEIIEVKSEFENFINKDYVFLTDTYFAYYDFGVLKTDTSIYRDIFDIYAYALKTTPLSEQDKSNDNCKISEVAYLKDPTSIIDTYYLVAQEKFNIVAENSKGEGVTILSFDGGKTSKHVIKYAEFYNDPNHNPLDYKAIYAGKNAVILEKRNFVADKDVVYTDIREGLAYYNYSYKFLTFGTNGYTSKDLSLDGCSKIVVESQSIKYLSDSFVVYRQMVNDNHTLIENYICTYFDRNLNSIFEYSSNEMERILFTGEGSFLTNKRLISTRRNMAVVTRVSFATDIEENKFELYSFDVKNSVFTIRANGGLYGLMDFNGNVLVDPFEHNFKPVTISNDYVFGVLSNEIVSAEGSVIEEEYCIFNVKQKSFTKLDIEDGKNYYKLLENGFEGYFVYDANSDSHKLFGLNGGLIDENIENVDFYRTKTGAVVEIESNGKTSSIVIESNKYFSFEKSNEIENYSFSIGADKKHITIRVDGNNGLFGETYTESADNTYRGRYFTSIILNLNAFGKTIIKVELFGGNEETYKVRTFDEKGNLLYESENPEEYANRYGFVEFKVPIDAKDISLIDGYSVVDTISEYYKFKVELKSYTNDKDGNNPDWYNVTTIYKWWYRGYSPSQTEFKEFDTELKKPNTILPGSKYLGYFDGINPYDLQCITENGVISRDATENKNETWYALFASSTYNLAYNLNPDKDPNYNPDEYVEKLPTIADFDSSFYIPIPVRKGYIFKGWTIRNMCKHNHYFSDKEIKGKIIYFSKKLDGDNHGSYSDEYYLYDEDGINNITESQYPNTDYKESKIPYHSNFKDVTTLPNVTFFRCLKHGSGTVTFEANWEKTPDDFKIQYVFADDDKLDSNDESSFNQIAIYNPRGKDGVDYKSDVNFGGYVIEDEINYQILYPGHGGSDGNKIYWTTNDAFDYPDNFQSITVRQVFAGKLSEDAKKMLDFYYDYYDNEKKIKMYGYNNYVFLDPANYLVFGWYYKDRGGQIHRLDDELDNTKLEDTYDEISNLGSIDNIDSSRFKLYAYFMVRDFYVDYAWDEVGGSAVDSENDINTEHRDNEYIVSIKVDNSEESYELTFENNKKQMAVKDTNDGKLRFDWADRKNYAISMKMQVPYPYYLMDYIVLEHFPYKSLQGEYKTENFKFGFSWVNDSFSVIEPEDFIKAIDTESNTAYYHVNGNSEVNHVYFRGALTTDEKGNDVCEVVITIKNIDYTSLKKAGNYSITESSINNNSVKYFGTYGFVIKGKARSNYEKIDTVVNSEEFEFGTIDENNGHIDDGYSKYYVLPVIDNRIWIDGMPYNVNKGYNEIDISGKIHKVYYVVGSDENKKGYAYFNPEDEHNINYDNTQIIAISPKQSKIWASINNNGFYSQDFYELNKYLSEIVIGGQSFTLNQPTRNINEYEYEELDFSIDGSTKIDINSYDGAGFAIKYFGKEYTKLCGYSFEVNGCSYDLILAYDTTNNHVMYFLISDERLAGNEISFTFANFDKTINVTQKLEDSTDLYDNDSTTGVDTKYKYNNKNETWTSVNGFEPTTIKINPSDSYIFRFTPQEGYLINSVTIKIGNETIVSYVLNRSGIGLDYTSEGKVLFYKGETGSETSTIRYSGVYNSLKAYGSDSVNGNWGIYLGNYAGAGWNGTDPGFETLYLLVSGVYDDVSIEVDTVSFFEFEIKGNREVLGLDNVLKEEDGKLVSFNNSLLSILKKSNNNWAELSDFSDLGIYIKYNDAGFYRLIFFGAASQFEDGIAFYASGENYSYSFDNAKLYGQATKTNLFDGSISGKSLSVSGNEDRIIYLEADKLSSLFNNDAYTNDFNNEGKPFIAVNKYTLFFTLSEVSYELSSNSYLFNDRISGDSGKFIQKGSKYYQLDNESKICSWFNDTVLSNIDYFYRGAEDPQTNWQKDYNYNGLKISGINGYGLHFRYYEIPGYYLEYIDFKFSVSGEKKEVSLYMVEYATENNLFVFDGTTISCKIVYNSKDGYFDIFLYNNDEKASFEDIIESLGILAGNLNVNFFSMARSIDINLNANVDSDNVSSSAIFNQGSSNKITVYYDSLATINSYLSMEGYTFVGWGSQFYYDNDGGFEERFKPGDGLSVPNIWNSSSKWVDISSYFATDEIKDLKLLKTADMRSSDFYVAGGYFITDTGYKNTGANLQVQSYNFWSAYADVFMKSYGQNADADFKYVIDLYGIWKANTYNVILNLNDANVPLAEGSDKGNNGSTISFFKHKDYSFDTSSINKGVVGIGELKYNGNYKDATFNLFVTYDTNDWYVLINSTDGYSAQGAAAEKQSLKDYIIDRYGYTWLGWFAEKLENYKVTSNNKNSSALVVAKTDKFTDGAWSEDLPVLSSENYAKFTTKVDNIEDTIVVDKSNSVYNGTTVSRFIYKNQLGTFNIDQNVYKYFYIYNENEKVINGFNTFASIDYLNNYVSGYDSYFKYFDTSKDFNNFDNTRDITIFAYWETNYYDVIVDFRDSSSYIDSKTGIGSSSVSLADNFVFEKVYFDDESLTNRLNKFLPVRLGYDFVGWSFDPQPKTEEGLQIYKFSKAAEYIFNNGMTGLLYSNENARHDLTVNDKEQLGDGEDFHYVYMFAGWTAQTYTINVSLNIDKEGLDNLYRADSEFAIALYKALGDYSYGAYDGIRQSFAMLNENQFMDIVANVSFVITFDSNISSASFVINSGSAGGTSTTYTIKELFATSAGYYLIGWMFDPDNTNSMFVKNTLNSVFDEEGNLQNDDKEGASYFINDWLFNEDFYNELYHTSYVNGNTVTDNLFKIDFDSNMTANIVRSEDGNKYFDTFSYSSNSSTNFGFVTIDGIDYYLATENVNGLIAIYYYDADGIKQYVTPYIVVNNVTYVANESGSSFRFDNSNFYYENYVIYFDDSEEGFNAYYINNNYGNRVKLNIELVLKDNDADFEIVGKDKLNYTAEKTREFTIYAHWFKKNNLKVSANNGNNIGETSDKNNGLAGYFEIENSNEGNNSSGTAERNDEGYSSVHTDNESDVKLVLDPFNFYDDIKVDIMPYFNGRYLSEMMFKFYSYEETSKNPNGINSSYKKVLYTIYLKFGFDNNKRIPVINKELSSVSRNSVKISGVEFVQDDNGILKINGLNKLSNVDINAFDSGFLKIESYGEKLDRLDINPMHISMQNVKSDVEVTCKFSVQTFDIDFYNVYDNNGYGLASTGISGSEEYTVGGYNTLKSFLTAVDSARYADGVSSQAVLLNEGDIINLSGKDQPPRIATISSDCASSVASYNVPYGLFIYGNNQFDSPVSAEVGKGREEYGGYDFIYQYGYYKFGASDNLINSENFQASPLLGDPGLFGESIRKTSKLYTFVSWFEASEKNGTLILNEYSEKDENTYVSRNFSLFGYYYANNKPTNIQFYTWDDASHSYVSYTQNIDEYTLQASSSTSSYTESSTTIIEASEDGTMFADEKGRAIIKSIKSYGVDGVGFSIDNYTHNYINNDASGGNFAFVNDTLIRNYWYYRYQNYFLYYTKNGVDHYIRYDQDRNKFYYLDDENNSSGSRHYINIYSTDIKDQAFVIYADLDPENSGVVINNAIELEKYISEGIKLTRLSVDTTEYIYNLDGSRMYVYYNQNYYEIKKTEDFASDKYLTEAEKQEISNVVPNAIGTNVSAKYYVKLPVNFADGQQGGQTSKIYYLITSDGKSVSENLAGELYEYVLSDGNEARFVRSDFNSQISIVNLDNYYLMVDEDFYKVEFGTNVDECGVAYINPYTMTNICKVPVNVDGVEIVITLYFDYETKEFYMKNENGVLTDKLTDEIPMSRVYSPVNNNYSVSIIYNDETNKWEYDCVKIKTLPSPNIGFWYNNNSYSYVGYIKMLSSDIDYLVDKSLDIVDDSGNNLDPNKVPHRDRIYDTLYKYINTVYADLTEEERESLQNQALEYVSAYKNGQYYLNSIITVGKDGFIYKEGTNIIEYIDALITCVVPVTINGRQEFINATVKYRFNLIDSETVINDSIHAIPIYSANIIEYTSGAVQTNGTDVDIDISKMYVQYFETIENLYTQMYGIKYGDYLKFAVLNEVQFSSMINSKNYPSELSKLLSSQDGYGIWSETNPDGIRVLDESNYVSEVDGKFVWQPMTFDFSTFENGKYYIVAYYNKSGQTYPVRVADNTVCVTKSDTSISTSIVSTKVIKNTLGI